MMRMHFVTAGAVAFATILAPAWAQKETTTTKETTTSTTKETKSKSGSAAHFMKEAARGGLAEVELGNLAQQKASSDDVKQFGQRMVQDHTKANDQLKSIAEKEGVTLPTSLSAKDQALKNKLEGLSGSAFDKAYMEAMVKDHRMDVAEFQRASNSSDSNVKSFASETLPTLQEHLQMARTTWNKVSGKSTASRSAR